MSDYAKKTLETLNSELTQKREDLRVFRFGAAGSRSRNVREGRTIRKAIAQIMTEVSARNIISKAEIAKVAKTA